MNDGNDATFARLVWLSKYLDDATNGPTALAGLSTVPSAEAYFRERILELVTLTLQGALDCNVRNRLHHIDAERFKVAQPARLDLMVDQARAKKLGGEEAELTGICVRAKTGDGWISADIAQLEPDSLVNWLTGAPDLAINVVGILLGYEGRLIE